MFVLKLPGIYKNKNIILVQIGQTQDNIFATLRHKKRYFLYNYSLLLFYIKLWVQIRKKPASCDHESDDKIVYLEINITCYIISFILCLKMFLESHELFRVSIFCNSSKKINVFINLNFHNKIFPRWQKVSGG